MLAVHPRAGKRRLLPLLAAPVALAAIHFLLMVSLGDAPVLRSTLDNITFLAVYSGACLLLCRAAAASRGAGTRVVVAWSLFAAAQLASFLGTIALFAAQPYRLPPTLADTASTSLLMLNIPLMIGGFVLLPAVALTAQEKVALFIDLGIAVSAAVVLFGALWIMPMLAAPQAGPDVRMTMVLLLALDLAMLIAITAVLLLRADPGSFLPILVLAASSLLRIGTDIVFTARYLKGLYRSGELLDSVWLAGVVLIGVSALLRAPTGGTQGKPLAAHWVSKIRDALSTAMPAAWVAALAAILMANHYFGLTKHTELLNWGAYCSMSLAMVRLMFAVRAHRRLSAQLERRVQERTRELTEALASVRTLRGLLPICASCKKVRTDDGYWQQIEHFMRQNTDAIVSHGICPECARRLYPDLQDEDEKSAVAPPHPPRT